jgi:hypothetical protein
VRGSLLRPVHHLQQGVGEYDGIAAVQRQQQPLQRAAQPGIDPADSAPVEQAEVAVAQQQDVARVLLDLDHETAYTAPAGLG